MTPSRPQHQPIELLRIDIPSPCEASWDDMTGDHRVRHCSGCNKNVVNLSAMPAAEGAALISSNLDDELCVRMDARHDGSVVTADCADSARPMVRQPWRGLPGMAGAAVLALSAAGCVATDATSVAPAAASAAVEPILAVPILAVPIQAVPELAVTVLAGTPIPSAPVPELVVPTPTQALAPAPAPAKEGRPCENDAVREQLMGKPAIGHSMPYVFRDSKGMCTR